MDIYTYGYFIARWTHVFWDRLLPNVLDCTDVVKSVRHHQEQLEEARRIHHEELKASLAMHNHEVGVAAKLHDADVKVACKLHDREKEMALAMHNIALQVELLHASCENIRDTAEQYISKISTFLLIETLLLGSLFVVIIEAELPSNTQDEMSWLVLLYSITSGVSFLTLSTAVWLTYAVQERVLKLRRHALSGAFKAFKEHREHWTQSIEKQREFYFRLESEREHLHTSFDEDIETTKILVNRGSAAFGLGVLSLASSVVTVMFAKLALSFTDIDGNVQHAWAAAYTFTGLFAISIIILFSLVLKESRTDVLRPVIFLSGDYCVLWTVDQMFVDPGAIAKDLKQEGGEEMLMTDMIQISVCYHCKASVEQVELESKEGSADESKFLVNGIVDPNDRRAKLQNWTPDRPGIFVITYRVLDEKGNEGRASRTVIASHAYQRTTSVVPPSTPPSKLYLMETRKRNKSIFNVDIAYAHHSNNSSDFENGDHEAGVLEEHERLSKAFSNRKRETPHLSFNNLHASSGELD